jgi:hypothetical protein
MWGERPEGGRRTARWGRREVGARGPAGHVRRRAGGKKGHVCEGGGQAVLGVLLTFQKVRKAKRGTCCSSSISPPRGGCSTSHLPPLFVTFWRECEKVLKSGSGVGESAPNGSPQPAERGGKACVEEVKSDRPGHVRKCAGGKKGHVCESVEEAVLGGLPTLEGGPRPGRGACCSSTTFSEGAAARRVTYPLFSALFGESKRKY